MGSNWQGCLIELQYQTHASGKTVKILGMEGKNVNNRMWYTEQRVGGVGRGRKEDKEVK